MHANVIRATRCWKFLAVFACCLLFTVSLAGQSFYGSIVGTVTDSSGAALPGAAVTLSSADSGFRRTDVTAADGSYNFVNLVPGTYSVEVNSKGFNKTVRTGIGLEVQAVVRIDIQMQVGTVEQTVQVSAAAQLMQTENTSLGQVIGTQTVDDLPLNGRNVLNLVSLVPGVVTQGGAAGNLTTQNIFASGNYQINGGTANQNAMY
ncbi:MAG: carboxypeptidase-like regulatory domain-containing protein, partial [Candidatus Acidiferrales bacterium]